MIMQRIPDEELLDAFDSVPDFQIQCRNLADAQLEADKQVLSQTIKEIFEEIERMLIKPPIHSLGLDHYDDKGNEGSAVKP